jgi:hypothetical protein
MFNGSVGVLSEKAFKVFKFKEQEARQLMQESIGTYMQGTASKSSM